VKRKLLLLMFFEMLFFCKLLNAQDIQFSQFYAVPTYQNPAFVGSAHAPRGILHNRLQWLRLNANYKTLFVGGDTYLSKYNSGIGIIAMRDWQGDGILNSTEIGLQYSYELPVSSAVTVRAGLQGSLVSRSLNYATLRFPSEFTDTTGYTGPSGKYPTGSQNILYPDISAGGIAYSDKAWLGISAHHLNQPSQSFVDDPAGARLPMKVALTGGYKIQLQQLGYLAYNSEDAEISITPTFHYKFQGKSDQFDLGLYGIYDQLLVGFWYRGLPIKKLDPSIQNNEAVILFLGWKVTNWSFGYSYDITVSRLYQAKTRGAHEFNITYVHHVRHKRKPMKRLPCPSFYKN
jgi:type IX secretion system PorP/SprF family membrane protein